MRRLLPLIALCWVTSVGAQEPAPVEPAEGEDAVTGTRFGLLGFSARAGADFENDGQAVVSLAVELADLYTDRVRFRPSGELGVGSGANTFVGNAELIYRFTPDTEIAVPYVGFGIAVAGSEGCGSDPDCPGVWAQFALGFEVQLRETFSWLLEYRGEDALRRHRLFVGLTTRRAF